MFRPSVAWDSWTGQACTGAQIEDPPALSPHRPTRQCRLEFALGRSVSKNVFLATAWKPSAGEKPIARPVCLCYSCHHADIRTAPAAIYRCVSPRALVEAVEAVVQALPIAHMNLLVKRRVQGEHQELNSIPFVYTWLAQVHEIVQVTRTSRRILLHCTTRLDSGKALSRASMLQDCACLAAAWILLTSRRVYNTWRGTCQPNLCPTETNPRLHTAAPNCQRLRLPRTEPVIQQ